MKSELEIRKALKYAYNCSEMDCTGCKLGGLCGLIQPLEIAKVLEWVLGDKDE